jgi:hypothetical protein
MIDAIDLPYISNPQTAPGAIIEPSAAHALGAEPQALRRPGARLIHVRSWLAPAIGASRFRALAV